MQGGGGGEAGGRASTNKIYLMAAILPHTPPEKIRCFDGGALGTDSSHPIFTDSDAAATSE